MDGVAWSFSSASESIKDPLCFLNTLLILNANCGNLLTFEKLGRFWKVGQLGLKWLSLWKWLTFESKSFSKEKPPFGQKWFTFQNQLTYKLSHRIHIDSYLCRLTHSRATYFFKLFIFLKYANFGQNSLL